MFSVRKITKKKKDRRMKAGKITQQAAVFCFFIFLLFYFPLSLSPRNDI